MHHFQRMNGNITRFCRDVIYRKVPKVTTLVISLFLKLISFYCFLHKYSKELFDYGVGIHRQKEDFLKKGCNVPFELHKGMSMIIITVKHKSRISLLKLVVPTISFISSKKRNHFLSRYFRRVVILGDRVD